MLESLVKYDEVEKHPWTMFLWAMLLSSIGILLSFQLNFEITIAQTTTVNLTGLFAVLFSLIPSIHFLTVFINKQEKMDEKDIAKHYEKGFWMRHDKDVVIFLYYFFGLTFAFAFWALVMPAGTFQMQMLEIQKIRAMAGNILMGLAGGETQLISFARVLLNNLQVMGFAFVFSLLFGAGAVFVIVWNASILGVYVGRLSKTIFHIPGEMLTFLPHGIPEISGYVLAGIAGGIISAAIIRGHKKEIVMKVIFDAMKLLGIAILFVFLGALIETMDMTVKFISIFIFYTIFIYIITIAVTPFNEKGKKK